MTKLTLYLSNYPMGVVLEDVSDVYNPQVIDSECCSTIEEYVEFAREHADKIGDETQIATCVSFDEVDSTALMEFAKEVVVAIKRAIG